MRIKAALIIISIVCVITVVNFGSSLIWTHQTLKDTMSHDLSLSRDFVDDIISAKINLLKSDAQTVSERLAKADSEAEMEEVIRDQAVQFPDFIDFTVFSRSGKVFQYGDPLSDISYIDYKKYIPYAFEGETVITTIRENDITGELNLHICTPMGNEHVLGVTIPGGLFTHLLDGKKIYKTGQIFILDEEGILIVDYHTDPQDDEGAHFHENLIAERTHFSTIQKMFNMQNETGFFDIVRSGHDGEGNYTYNNEPYMCAYKQVSASKLGWSIIVTAPLSESPAASVQNRLVMLAVIFLISGVVIAALVSGYVAKPFCRIAEQNSRLEELNQINQMQNSKIQEAHRLTKLMMDATPICSMLWDENTNIFDCNEESIKMFRMKDKDHFLDRFFELSPEYQPDGKLSREKARECINEAFENGMCRMEWMHQLLDGTQIPCEMTLIRVEDSDRRIIAAYARDLREYKQIMSEMLQLQSDLEAALKEAQNANIAKNAFLANMSHEIRTPLNAVVGLSELILDSDNLEDEVEDRLERIHTSGITILGIVNDVLDISKIESGKFEICPVEYDTPSLINDIVTLNIVRIGEKPITFKLIVDEELPGMLLGDDLRIKQIFNNLLSNAFKYTHSGTVEWRLSSEKDGDNVWLVSSVKDSGIGIKAEDLAKLFSEYNQVDVKTNREIEGTGLGLAITKRLVEMMNGTIAVSSEYGKGTTFDIRILQGSMNDKPIGKEVAENLMNSRYTIFRRARHSKLVRINMSYAHVLVVDDMSTNLEVVKGMMKPYGLKVDCALSGLQAIDMIRAERNHYNAIFMDHMMPGIDGIEATRMIREEIGTDYARNIPIIALTANAIVGNEEMFLNNGFQAFISKPIDIMKLDAILRLWVRNKDLENAEEEYMHDSGGESLLAGVNIEGLDIDRCLDRFSGDEKSVIQVLHAYAGGTRPLINRLTEELKGENLADYAIIAHGIKGSSYGIFALEVGKAAEELEVLAKAGDLEAVKKKNNPFVEILYTLLSSLDTALAAIDNEKPIAATPDQTLLNELRDACDAYDMDRVDNAITQLESFRYESNEKLIEWLREHINNMTLEVISQGEWPLAS